MCQYRYDYYPSCRHQEVVLFDFCANARPLSDTQCASHAPARSGADGCEDLAGSAMVEDGEGVAASNSDDLPSTCSPAFTHASHSSESSFGRGSVSITAEPSIDCSSLQSADHSHSYSSAITASHDMAGLPLFGGTFRQWMYGASPIAPKQGDVDSNGHIFTSSKRPREDLQDIGSCSLAPHAQMKQPGIREHTDESCDLPKSNDILQYLAESCRNLNPHYMGTNDHRLASYGSSAVNTVQYDSEATCNDYDTLEAQIDQLKEDVSKLREEADSGRTGPKTADELQLDKFLSTRSRRKLLVLDEAKEESAATRLQREHEANMRQSSVATEMQTAASVPPSPLDFPALGQSHSSSKVVSPTATDGQLRRTSYAHAATSGMMDAIDQAFSSSGKKRSDSKISATTSNGFCGSGLTVNSSASRVQTSSTVATQDSEQIREEDGAVNMVAKPHSTTSSPAHRPTCPNPKASTPDGKTARQSPHFAQPTKSFARRTGETLRKASASVSPQSPAEGSPTKNVNSREPSLATTKRASQQQKRKSLPGCWLGSPGQQHDHLGPEAVAKAGKASSIAMHTIPPPKGMSPPPKGMSSPSSVEKIRVKQDSKPSKFKKKTPQPESPLRKKTSSYMTPTSAATQRSIATLGGEKTKAEHTKTKCETPDVHTSQSTQSHLQPSRPNTACSDLSSVQFILEQQDGNAKTASNPFECRPGTGVGTRSRSQTEPKSLLPVPSGRSLVPRSEQVSPAKASKAPQAVWTSRQNHSRSESKASDSLTTLPEIANTTTKRRTSHGHLLKPIVACLDAKGLLNRNSTSTVVEAYLQSTATDTFGTALNTAGKNQLQPLSRRSEAQSSTSHGSHETSDMRKVLPPHLRRSRETSAMSTSTEGTLCQNNINGLPSLDHSGASSGQTHPRSDVQSGVMNGSPELPSFEPKRKPLVKSSTTPVLRATAREFTPLQPLTSDVPVPDFIGPLDYIPEEKWVMLPLGMRRRIQEDREMHKLQGWHSDNNFRSRQSQPGAPSKHVSHRSWAGPMSQTSTGYMSNTIIDENGSPHGIYAGQVLKPDFSPGKKTVQWMLQDLDGKETPINFGRAPPPEAGLAYEPLTPTISSTSNDTSPLKTPHSVSRWQIGSAYSPNPYAWAGRDGKEIEFVGYGPYAERDPNSVVNFNFNGRTSSFGTSVPNGFSEDKENYCSAEYVAPRSQRQWAQKLEYHKVPCGNVEITHAVEHLPFGSQLAGYCHDCMAN